MIDEILLEMMRDALSEAVSEEIQERQDTLEARIAALENPNQEPDQE